jgi:hypothetical protein
LVVDPFRPARRRRVIWPIVIVILLAGAVALALTGDESPTLYAEDLRSQAAAVSRKARTFQDMVARISSVDRVELTETVDDLDQTIVGVRDFLEGQDAPPELAGSIAVFRLSLQSWDRGATAFRDGLLRAADDPFASGVEDQLINALLELRAGDRLYAAFVADVSAQDVAQPVSGMPAVAFLPDPYPIVPGAQTMAALARTDGSPLELRSALAIDQVTTSPEWILDTEDALVVESTELVTVKVVVANRGNTGADPREVFLSLTGSQGNVEERSLTVPALEPGAKTTVSFDDLSVSPGRSYELRVRLALAEGEAQNEDNARTVRFRVNDATTGESTTTTGAG